MFRQPFVVAVSAYIIAIISARSITINPVIGGFVGVIGSVISLFFLTLFQTSKWKKGSVFFILFFSGLVVFSLHQYTKQSIISDKMEERYSKAGDISVPAEVIGQLSSRPIIDGDVARFYVNTSIITMNERSIKTKGEKIAVRIELEDETEKLQAGQLRQGMWIRMKSDISEPPTARNPGAFDYAAYLSNKRIYWQGTVEGLSRVHYSKPQKLSLLYVMGSLRETIYRTTMAIFPKKYSGLMAASLIGIEDDLDLEMEEDFSALGLVHIMAISGMNVALVVGMLYWFFSTIGLTRERKIQLTFLFLPLFIVLTGAEPPVVRAGIVASAVLYAQYRHKPVHPINLICFAAFLMLLIEPLFLYQLSFQLSFGATIGLLLWVGKLDRLLQRVRPSWIRSLLTVTVIAQLVSFPFMIYYFNQFSPWSFIANLLIVPLFSIIIIPFGYAALILYVIHPSFVLIPKLLIDMTLNVIDVIVSMFSSLPGSHTIWGTPSALWIICYTIVLFLVLELSIRQEISRIVKIGFLSLLLLTMLYAYVPLQFNKDLTVTFLDVGQGDCVLIQFPDRSTMLIDAGGQVPFQEEAWRERRNPYEPGKDVVVPFLMHEGIRTLDTVVITHGDYDHAGGMPAVFEWMNVRKVVSSPLNEQRALEASLLQIIRKAGIDYIVPDEGNIEQFSKNLRLTYINGNKEADKANNQSVVLLLQYLNRSFLFTGDIEKETEYKLSKEWAIPAIDVMKVAHHGSRTSTTELWLNETKPEIAVISVGVHNRFGHPSSEVLERIKQAGTRVYRTDQNGAITFKVDRKGRMDIDTIKN